MSVIGELATDSAVAPVDTPLVVAGVEYASRLLVGTGKYRDFEETREAIEASGAQIVTVAIRRTNIGQDPDEPNLLDFLSPDRYTILPNTAGCFDARSAVRTCKLARELLDGHDLVKLEVLGDEKTLFPDITATLEATEELVRDDFKVMVYTNDDPVIAKRLEAMGCVAVMPLAAPIGSGLGIRNPYNILTIVENASAHSRGRRRRYRLRCGHRHGAGMRRRAHEHRHCSGQASGADGIGDEEGHRGGTRGLSRRAHAAQAFRQRFVTHRRHYFLNA